jgi:hypothetical protein
MTLTLKTKSRIKELVGTCEYCDIEISPDQLEIYLFSPIARPEYRKENDPINTLIVLCNEHYAQVMEGEISKTSLKSKMAGRSDKKKKELRSALRKNERTYGRSGVVRIRDPTRFSVSLPDHSGNRR